MEKKAIVKDGRSFGFDGMYYTGGAAHSQSLVLYSSQGSNTEVTFRDLEASVRIAANANKDVLLVDSDDQSEGKMTAIRLSFTKI